MLEDLEKCVTTHIIQTKDNLDALRQLPSKSVDHAIFDPPFNSNRLYTGIPTKEGNTQVMDDIWEGGEDTYLFELDKRIDEINRILTDDGTIIIHCDDTVCCSLDGSLKSRGLYFRCNIRWSYSGGGIPKHNPPNKCDSILVFSKTNDKSKWIYNPVYRHYSIGTKKIAKHSSYSSGADIDIDKGTPITNVWDSRGEYMDRIHAEDEHLGWSFKPDFGKISPIINNINSGVDRAITEKPIGLYKRIIYMFTNEGDVVLDPYMGGGTTIISSAELERSSIGMERDIIAYDRTVRRLVKSGITFTENDNKTFINEDSDLLDDNAWADYHIMLDGGIPNPKKSGDGGIDGWNSDLCVLYQVKKHYSNIGVGDIRDFHSAAISKMKEFNWEFCTLKFISLVGYTSSSKGYAAKVSRTMGDKMIYILTTGADIAKECENSKPLIVGLVRKNGDIHVIVDNHNRRIVKYTWFMESRLDQKFMFNLIPKPIIKVTTDPILNLKETNIKDINYLRCELIDRKGNKFIKEMIL